MMDERWRLTHEMEDSFEWGKWNKEIPFIPIYKDWEIKIIPPFSGAVVRFLVREPGGDDISVYLDCYDTLGCFGSPYWEIYPSWEGETARYKMDDIDGLLDGLERALEKIGENKEKYEKARKIVRLEEQLESSRAESRLLRDEIEKMELAYNTLEERYRRLKDETRSD